MAQLVYETTDTDFADRAIEAMRNADIPCHRIGRGYSSQAQHPGKGFTEDQVCLYIERDTDYTQANEILIRLGAATESNLPPRWAVFLFIFVAAAVAVWFALVWK